jgi:ATP-dependent Clp protease ATP-binding subunit ClpA
VLAAVRARPRDAIDADALADVGIDLDAVRAQVEASFGPGALDARPSRSPNGHLPFDSAAKKLLEISLREALRYKHRRIDTGHLLLAVARLDDTAAHRVLSSLGVDADRVREAVAATWADVPVG